MNDWKTRHAQAFANPRGPEVPMVHLITAWTEYAEHYNETYKEDDNDDGYQIGQDYVLGKAWIRIGISLREMLNGDCGRLDCGTLDGLLVGYLTEAGIDVDTYVEGDD